MKYLGSKEIETERLFLRSSKMPEQKRLWEILMIPEVNKWYLTSSKKNANNIIPSSPIKLPNGSNKLLSHFNILISPIIILVTK